MTIYGVALLALCFLAGKILGLSLGDFLEVDGDIGGVGFAMILLMLTHGYLTRRGMIKPETTGGILFWSSMYIPIIVAMAATQNVKAAIAGGPLALLAGITAVAGAFALVPVISRLGKNKNTSIPADD